MDECSKEQPIDKVNLNRVINCLIEPIIEYAEGVYEEINRKKIN